MSDLRFRIRNCVTASLTFAHYVVPYQNTRAGFFERLEGSQVHDLAWNLPHSTTHKVKSDQNVSKNLTQNFSSNFFHKNNIPLILSSPTRHHVEKEPLHIVSFLHISTCSLHAYMAYSIYTTWCVFWRNSDLGLHHILVLYAYTYLLCRPSNDDTLRQIEIRVTFF